MQKQADMPRYLVKRTFCIYDAPSPEAIRKSAATNRLPVD
jgi:hypothetical protein